jgi:hypothetical protein
VLRRWLQPILGLCLVGVLPDCGGSSSETPFPLEPDLAMLDAAGPPRGSEYVVFTGQSAEPPSEPPPARTRQPIPEPEPEPEPEPLVPLPSDAGTKGAKDAGVPNKDASVPVKDAGAPTKDAGVAPAKDAGSTKDASAPRDASRD